jgi:hypothetical protein
VFSRCVNSFVRRGFGIRERPKNTHASQRHTERHVFALLLEVGKIPLGSRTVFAALIVQLEFIRSGGFRANRTVQAQTPTSLRR